jgi:hypothetical protein
MKACIGAEPKERRGARGRTRMRSLRSARGAAHSEDPAADAVLEEHLSKEYRN